MSKIPDNFSIYANANQRRHFEAYLHALEHVRNAQEFEAITNTFKERVTDWKEFVEVIGKTLEACGSGQFKWCSNNEGLNINLKGYNNLVRYFPEFGVWANKINMKAIIDKWKPAKAALISAGIEVIDNKIKKSDRIRAIAVLKGL